MNNKAKVMSTVLLWIFLSAQALAEKLGIKPPSCLNTTLERVYKSDLTQPFKDALISAPTGNLGWKWNEVLLDGNDDPIDELLPYAQNKTTLESESDGTITYYTMPEATRTSLDSLHVSLTKVLIGSDGEWIIEARLLVKNNDGIIVGIIHRDHVNPNALNSDDVNPKKEQGANRTDLRLSWWLVRAKKTLGK